MYTLTRRSWCAFRLPRSKPRQCHELQVVRGCQRMLSWVRRFSTGGGTEFSPGVDSARTASDGRPAATP